MARSVRRKSATQSPAKSRTTASPRQTRNSKRTLSRDLESFTTRRKQHAPLEAVEEDEDTIVLNTGAQNTEIFATASPGPHESFASLEQTDDESDDFSDLDFDDITDALDDIDSHSSRVLNMFESEPVYNVIHSIRDTSTKKGRRFEKLLDRLDKDLEPCGRGSMIFLPLFRISTSFPNRALPIGVKEVFFKSNLALLMAKLAEIGDKDQAIRTQLLQALNTADGFPMLFLDFDHIIDRASTHFRLQTCDAAMTLLVQYYIDIYEREMAQEGFDSTLRLQQVFQSEEPPMPASSSSQHRGLLKSRVPEVMAALRKLSPRRSSVQTNLTRLKGRYPWAAAVEQFTAWAKDAHNLLNEIITAEGGVRKLLEGLEQSSILETQEPTYEAEEKSVNEQRDVRAVTEEITFLREMDTELDVNDQAPDEAESEEEEAEDATPVVPVYDRFAPHRTNSSGVLREMIQKADSIMAHKHVQAIEEEEEDLAESIEAPPRSLTPRVSMNLNQAGPSDHEENGASVQNSREVPLTGEEHSVPDIRPTQETLEALNIIRMRRTESNKENVPTVQRYKLTDRQPGAVRVSWDDEPSQQPRSRTKKRTREQSDSDDEEGDFERSKTRERQVRPYKGKSIAQTTDERAASPMFVPEEQRPVEEEGNGDHDGTMQSHGRQILRDLHIEAEPSQPGPSAPRTTQHSERTISPESERGSTPPSRRPPPSSYAETHEEIKRQAAQNVARAAIVTLAERPERAPQVRRAWEKEEIEALYYYMNTFGAVWAKIKERDSASRNPRLLNRTQVQLKDKARNMKMDYLRAELPLPACLVPVTISQRQVEDLRRKGIVVPEQPRRGQEEE